MPRDLPGAFRNKDTYSVNVDPNRDRLPALDQGTKCTLQGILTGGNSFPIRLCIAAIKNATDVDDIAKLVIGALLDGSGVSSASAKLNSPSGAGYITELKQWTIAGITGNRPGDAAEVPEEESAVPLEPTTSTVPDNFPLKQFPEWYQELDPSTEDYLFAAKVDPMELAAYAGILAYAIGKQPTAENMDAFNSRRRNAISQFLPAGDLKIFVDDSEFLSIDILGKIHRAFNSVTIDRALVMSAIVDKDAALVQGREKVFYIIFRLGSGASLNPLLIITRFARKYPYFYSEFPDLETEYHAAAHALQRFFDVPEKRRMYLKVIFGSAYVPVDRTDVNELLGVSVFALQQSEPSLANYNGGTLSVVHRQKLIRLLEVASTNDEEIPEEQLAE